jgi:hypothetical protein
MEDLLFHIKILFVNCKVTNHGETTSLRFLLYFARSGFDDE